MDIVQRIRDLTGFNTTKTNPKDPLQQLVKFPAYMQPKDSSFSSKKPTTRPDSDPIQSSPHLHILSKINVNISHTSMTMPFEWSLSFLGVLQPKFFMDFLIHTGMLHALYTSTILFNHPNNVMSGYKS
jgi:hypothetical protein